MAISRKNFGALSINELKKTVDELSGLIQEAATGREGVDLAAVRAEVEKRQDPSLTSAFERVSLEYNRFCDSESHRPAAQTHIPPANLKSVMNMMIDAKKAFHDFDANDDGELQRDEVLYMRHSETGFTARNHSHAIAGGVAYGANKSAEDEVKLFLRQFGSEEYSRGTAYRELVRRVGLVAPSPKGKRALMAHLEDFLVSIDRQLHMSIEDLGGSPGDNAGKNIQRILRKAESSFLRRLFNAPKLDDKEIAELIGTDDFDVYAESIDKKMHDTFGTSFAELWFDGHDLEGEKPQLRFYPPPS